jgi:RNA recognition motif-containing protein
MGSESPYYQYFIIAVTTLIAFIAGLLLGKRLPQGHPAARRPEKEDTEGDVEIYVGNLAYDLSESDLHNMFEKYGRVDSARIISNKFNNKSKGYGFVNMPDPREAQAAIQALNAKEIKGRALVVNEAKSRSRGH